MARPTTLITRLEGWASRSPDAPALHSKGPNGWSHLTWKEYHTAVEETARGLIALGHAVGDCVAIVGDNRPEWVIAQLGIMAARGIPAPIYTNSTDDQTAYIVSHCRAKLAFCDKKEQLDKYRRAIAAGLMKVDKIITMDELGEGPDLLSLSALRKLGRATPDGELQKRLNEATDSETSLLIYTSGTTGVPKAVKLDAGGAEALVDAVLERLSVLKELDFRVVSYLPLSHIAEQAVTNFAHLTLGGQVYFCPDLKQVKDYLLVARPTAFLGVPRVWEKFEAALKAKLGDSKGLKRALADWAMRTESQCFHEEVRTGRPSWPFTRTLANKLVIGKVKEALGLGDLRLAVSGAAPLGVGTMEYFASLGIVIHEAYGMSETTALVTANPYGRPRFGTVGPALKGVTLRIAEDGEVVAKGRNMSTGYLHDPEKTAELIDPEGWLHTGDLGEFDADGFLKITGRKKDLIITAGGKNVAPAEMEALIKLIPGVGQVVVVGDRQPYLCALLTLDPEGLPGLCARVGIPQGDLAAVAASPQLRDWLTAQIEAECNTKVARYQTIKRFDVLPVEFTVEGGEMTPTMKIKRNVVVKKYEDRIAQMYAAGGGEG